MLVQNKCYSPVSFSAFVLAMWTVLAGVRSEVREGSLSGQEAIGKGSLWRLWSYIKISGSQLFNPEHKYENARVYIGGTIHSPSNDVTLFHYSKILRGL